MIISPNTGYTLDSPTQGVQYDDKDTAEMVEIAKAYSAIPYEILSIIKSGLAMKIMDLRGLGQWTSGESEIVRQQLMRNAILAYEAVHANTFMRVL